MYEIFAIKYASFSGRKAHENFLLRDMHDVLMPIDYFVWLLKSEGRFILVDTGFDEIAAHRRGRSLSIPPDLALRKAGVAPEAISDVIITHLHFDHAGNISRFPNATFHIQDREMAYATGRCMCHKALRMPFDVEPVIEMVRCIHSDRVKFHNGSGNVAPGVDLQWVGGHSDGLQVVTVKTSRGKVVLASDAAHYYENITRENPFPLVFNVGDMIAGWKTVLSLAGGLAHTIPGHDPLVCDIYQNANIPEIEAFCLHLPPKREVIV